MIATKGTRRYVLACEAVSDLILHVETMMPAERHALMNHLLRYGTDAEPEGEMMRAVGKYVALVQKNEENG